MRTVNIHQAKTQLSRLVEQAAKGDPFVIARAGKPLVKDLFLYGEDNMALARYMAPYQSGPLLWLNRARRGAMMLTERQRGRGVLVR